MSGHWGFIWGAYGVTALCLAAEVILLLQRRRTMLRRVGRNSRTSSGDGNETKA